VHQVLRSLVCAILLVVALSSLFSLLSSRRRIPPQLQPFGGEQLLFQVHGKGDQVYVCQEDAGTFALVLKAPDAKLFDKDGKPFGKHFGWEARGGSQVTGKPVVNVDWKSPRSIPWQLIDVVNHERSDMLSHVTTIQRLNTRGGEVPFFGCKASHAAPGSSRAVFRRLAFLRAEIMNAHSRQ
jgi:hypothetical protein